MDGMVALVTREFHDSPWTDQEIGFAMGRGVPVVAVRLEKDPCGFIGIRQALRGCTFQDIPDMAAKVAAALHKCLPDPSHLFQAAVSAYAKSDSFADSAWKVQHTLSLFEKLNQKQVHSVIQAFRGNLQNRESFKGRTKLCSLLEKWTGRKWVIQKNDLQEVVGTPVQEDDFPF